MLAALAPSGLARHAASRPLVAALARCASTVKQQRRGLYGGAGGGPRPLKVGDLLQKKRDGVQKLTMITAYDYLSARIADAAAVDMLLVGDSLANVILGHPRTAAVGVDEMLHHTRAVVRGARRALVVGDLPFGAYSTVALAQQNTERFMREGCGAVKLEGPLYEQIAAAARLAPVCAHLGVLPQTAHNFLARGKTAEDAAQLVREAEGVAAAGASFLVLEKVTTETAAEITRRLPHLPTIGIGAGPHCDGQVLVWHDVMGAVEPGAPQLKFVRRFADQWRDSLAAVERYATAVESGEFPSREHSFPMDPLQRQAFAKWADSTRGATPPSAQVYVPAPPQPPVRDASTSPQAAAPPAPTGPVLPQGVRDCLVVGSGALGSLMAWHLAGVPGLRVTVATGWADRAAAIAAQGGIGLLKGGVGDDSCVRAVSVCDNAGSGLADRSFDLALICVKSQDTERAAQLVLAKLRPEGAALSLQNGLEAPSILKRKFAPRELALPAEQHRPTLLLGTTTYGAHLPHPARPVSLLGTGVNTVAAAAPGEEAAGAAETVSELLRQAGLQAEAAPAARLKELQWRKLAANAAINPLTALFGVSNGALAAPHFKPLLRAVAEETVGVARLRGVRLSLEETLAALERTVAATAANTSSMLADLRAGRPTEAPAICGSVVREAQRAGVSAPVSETMLRLVLAAEQEAAAKKARTADAPSTPAAAPRIVRTPREVTAARRELERAGTKVVYVPFLGGLHAGHLALVDEARRLAGPDGQVWTSLFLNRLQFQQQKDFDTYPMVFERDVEMLADKRVDLIFAPSMSDMYATPEDRFPPRVDFLGVEGVDGEGRTRPGFFRGVGTVVTKFLAFMRPDVAVFGQKDFQQTVLVRRLVDEFFPDTALVVHPTVRESDGLAFASRNARLSAEERVRAPLVFQLLMAVRQALLDGQRDADALRQTGLEFGRRHGLHVDYLTLADYLTGVEVAGPLPRDRKHALAIGASLSRGGTRLVDNLVLEDPAPSGVLMGGGANANKA